MPSSMDPMEKGSCCRCVCSSFFVVSSFFVDVVCERCRTVFVRSAPLRRALVTFDFFPCHLCRPSCRYLEESGIQNLKNHNKDK